MTSRGSTPPPPHRPPNIARPARTTSGGTRLVAVPATGRGRRTPGPVGRPVTRRRLWVVLAGVVVVFGLVTARLAELQVLNPDRYVATGEQQRFRSQVLAADRGSILDRNGEELALSMPQVTVYTDPRFVAHPADVAADLAPILGVDEARLRAELEGDRDGDSFGYLARQIPDAVADDVRAYLERAEVDGVYLTEEPTRFTPAGDLARSVVGEVDIDNNGLSGIEAQYAEQLTGTPGEVVLEASIDGKTIPSGAQRERPAVRGDDVVLTLDRSLQYEVERIVSEQVEAVGAESGTAVVTDPSTGEILAMTSVIASDEGTVVPIADNRAVTTVYEPGSVMKIITIAGALEAGVVEPDTTLRVPDAVTIADKTFTEHDPHGTVSWTVADILTHSSNVGTIKVGQALGREGIEDSYRRFGFGARTTLEYPNQQAGHLPPVEEWWTTSAGTIPIGHGVSATPLQVLMAYNVIANRGTYVPPTLVRGTVDPSGDRRLAPPAEGRRVVSERTADEMNLMLRDVIAAGTGQAAAVRGFTPAGKTGTARKVQPNGGYTNENGVTEYMSTFVGFVPAEDPVVSIIVVIDEPAGGEGGYTGGMVAAPAFARIAEFALRTGEVPPPRTDAVAARLGLDADVARPDTVLTDEDGEGAVVREDGKVRAVPAGDPGADAVGDLAADPVSTGSGR